MRIQVISTALLVLVYIFNYMSSNGTLGQGMTQLADTFPFPYMPDGRVFMIAWALIYLSLRVYLMYSWSDEGQTAKLHKEIAPWFRISCLLNILWIVSTAMELYVISVALIAGLFVILGTIIDIISRHKVSKREFRSVTLPFGFYYGWISLATSIIATSQLVYQRNIALTLGQTWTIVAVGTGLLVATYSRFRWRNVGQLLISLFAFVGIALALFSG